MKNDYVKLLIASIGFIIVLALGGWRVVLPTSEVTFRMHSKIKEIEIRNKESKFLADSLNNIYLYKLENNTYAGVINSYNDNRYGYISIFIALLVIGIPFRIVVF